MLPVLFAKFSDGFTFLKLLVLPTMPHMICSPFSYTPATSCDAISPHTVPLHSTLPRWLLCYSLHTRHNYSPLHCLFLHLEFSSPCMLLVCFLLLDISLSVFLMRRPFLTFICRVFSLISSVSFTLLLFLKYLL